MDNVIVLPNQLFEVNRLITRDTTVYLIEHPVYFDMYNYHKMKLVFHRSTFKSYEHYLSQKYKCTVNYIDCSDYSISKLKRLKNNKVHLFDPVDHHVSANLKKMFTLLNCEYTLHDSPLFICNKSDLEEFMNDNTRIRHSEFYKWQRKRLNLLLNHDGEPLGGQWSYDTENRDSYNHKIITNETDTFNKKNVKYNPTDERFIEEAKKYVSDNFPMSPGSDELYVPINHRTAKIHFNKFLKNRLNNFGKYQDAVNTEVPFGYHSVISSSLNIGLLDPLKIVKQCISYSDKHKIPIQSVEGFIRQIIGWREIQVLLYVYKRQEMEQLNIFNNTRKLKSKWFKQNNDYSHISGFQMIDNLMKNVMNNCYLHHIERLMYMGSYFLLNRIDPKDVFKWFISVCSLDAYHWVMYGNIYCMSQHSTGPLLMTKPYFSSSNYIDKMSNYKKKPDTYAKIKLNNIEYEWYTVWDALYYSFLLDNKDYLSKNYSFASHVNRAIKLDSKEKATIRKITKMYFDNY